MRKRSYIWITSMLALVVMCAALLPVVAQTPAPGFKPAKTAFGQPNFQGIWQAMGSAHYDLEPHGASMGVLAGVGVIVDPADGKIPYTPAGLAKKQENWKNRATADPHSKCFKAGIPHMMYLPFPFQIMQSTTQVTVLSEYMHGVRNIFLNRKEHYPSEDAEFWNGDSLGKFDGDSLVVDVANMSPNTWLDRAGNHNSEALHVTERFTLIDADTIRYEATMEDAKTYTKPWKISVLLYRRKEPNLRIMEYECHAYGEHSLGEPKLPTVQ